MKAAREAPFADEDAEESAPQIPDAADPAHHRRIRDAAKREAAEAQEWWTATFASDPGRREMWKILESTGFFRDRFAVATPSGFPDQLATYQFSGQQSVGRQLYLSWLRICPEGVNRMLAEHHPDLKPIPKPPRQPRKERFEL